MRAPRLPRLPLATLALAGTLLAAPARALVVPLTGWTPVNGNANLWTDPQGACLVREERHDQAFPAFNTLEEARQFALRLQNALGRGGASEVTAQPVDRPGGWGILAAYTHDEGGVLYRISQLYLSDEGRLRTITASSAQYEASPCVNDMRSFVRYVAN
ncbi:hypothetical protein DAERI_050106 [Deinococcus aerius]|uniref:Uncharacterized protein n=1 Tax=Deinococcus aerius TaxID=200253 RepID=A0A2I9DSU1_9DEIO|nr:hypothetical protein [Deinococcus aerius]GBF05597.1 hypothetical protein DAERI_050106 [Deinococcus aerius]